MLLTNFAWLHCLTAIGFSAIASTVADVSSSEQQKLFGENEGTKWLTPQFDLLVERTLDRFKVPGLAIAVVDGERIYAKVSLQLVWKVI